MRPLTNGLAISAALSVLYFTTTLPVLAQMRHTPAPVDSLIHVYAIVPLTGAGTAADPVRPMFAPALGIQPVLPTAAPGTAAASPRSGIVAYHMQVSDDGKQALVEFIAVSKADLQPILTTSDSRVQVFVRGEQAHDAILAAFQAVKKNFSFDKFIAPGVH
jgi:hypothetical protein